MSDLIEKTANKLLLQGDFKLNNVHMKVNSIHFEKNITHSNLIVVKALSPITVYSTYKRRDGTKITHYFSPRDLVFEHLVEENFANKYQAYTGISLPNKKLLSIRPLQVSDKDKVVTNYKSTWITGWMGIYELSGEPEYLSFLLNTGVSAKNSIGFGCVTPLDSMRDYGEEG